jgi:hypothetical protein
MAVFFVNRGHQRRHVTEDEGSDHSPDQDDHGTEESLDNRVGSALVSYNQQDGVVETDGIFVGYILVEESGTPLV